ncbi:MAG: nucleotidyltransferase domain-containing protein [Nitrospirae bacterium]|nr:MAG: nucleotidyltransferase domain-containing protein [Nitrospirota bacterium]
MVKTEDEIKEITDKFKAELISLGITPSKIFLYGSYAEGMPREDSDIDYIVISNDFKGMNIRERLEILGLAAVRVFEPIEALGYTEDEIKSGHGTFVSEILKKRNNQTKPL